MKYFFYFLFFVFIFCSQIILADNKNINSNILQNYLENIYKNINLEDESQLNDLYKLYNYNSNFKKLDPILKNKNPKLINLKIKHYLNTAKIEKLLKIKKQYPKYLYLRYKKDCKTKKGKFKRYYYQKTPQFDIQIKDVFPNKTKGCIDLKYSKNKVTSYAINTENTKISPFLNKLNDKSNFELFIYQKKYKQLKNKDRLPFIKSIKNLILRDYFELNYYSEIDNLIAYYDKIESIENFDIFLTLPHYLRYLKFSDYKKYKETLLNVYNSNKNNLAVLFFYEQEFKEFNLDLGLIDDFFLSDYYHIDNQINQNKKLPYNKAIHKIIKIIKLSPYNLELYEKIIPWNDFYKKNPHFKNIIYFYPDKKKPKSLLYNKTLVNIDKYILENKSSDTSKSFKTTISQNLYNKLFNSPNKKTNTEFFNEELENLTENQKTENYILKLSKNINLDKEVNYETNTKEAIYFGNKHLNNTYYEINYIQKEEKIIINNAFIYHKDRKITLVDNYDVFIPYEYEGLYSDMKILRYNLSEYDLSQGDVFYIDYTIKNTPQRDYFNNKISILEKIKPKSEILDYSYTISYPKSLKLKFSYNKNYLKKTESLHKNSKILKFTSKNLASFVNEPYYQFFYKEEPYISVSNFKTWNEVEKWFETIIFDKNEPLNEQNKIFFKELVKKNNLKTKEEIAKFFYDYFLDNIHYVGIELGIHSYKPYPPNVVFENKYGDCKDRALLYHEVMKLFDIKSQMVILSTSDSGEYDFDIPSYSYFNHAIIYLPEINKFLDLTNYDIPFGYLPTFDINSFIIILGNKEKIKKLKIPQKEIIKKEFTYIPKKNRVEVIHKEFYHGNTINRQLDAKFSLKKINYEKYINLYYNKILDKISFLPKVKTRISPKVFHFKYDFFVNSTKFIIKLFQNDDLFIPKFIQNAIRVNSFIFNYNVIYKYSFDFSKFKNLYGFSNEEIDNKFFEAKLFIKNKKVYFSFRLKTNYISAEEHYAFKKKLKHLDEVLNKKYYLEFYDDKQ